VCRSNHQKSQSIDFYKKQIHAPNLRKSDFKYQISPNLRPSRWIRSFLDDLGRPNHYIRNPILSFHHISFLSQSLSNSVSLSLSLSFNFGSSSRGRRNPKLSLSLPWVTKLFLSLLLHLYFSISLLALL
jgi:hypothetical protein